MANIAGALRGLVRAMRRTPKRTKREHVSEVLEETAKYPPPPKRDTRPIAEKLESRRQAAEGTRMARTPSFADNEPVIHDNSRYMTRGERSDAITQQKAREFHEFAKKAKEESPREHNRKQIEAFMKELKAMLRDN